MTFVRGAAKSQRAYKTGRQSDAEILVVGNELLNGTILDTNSDWLSKQLTNLGFLVSRKTTVRDDLSVITRAFLESMARKPKWLFSLGGLGPTYDDKTLQGLSKALGRKLAINPVALEMLKERYRTRPRRKGQNPPRVTKYSLKMVTLPVGSTPLLNRQGSAPGVFYKTANTNIVSLPGVPIEMKAIMKDAVFPTLMKDPMRFMKREVWFELVGVGESKLAPLLLQLSKKYSPSIYVKSHPRGFRDKRSVLKIQVIASSLSVDANETERKLEEVVSALRETSMNLGASFTHSKSI